MISQHETKGTLFQKRQNAITYIPEYMPIIQWSVVTWWCLHVLEYFLKFDPKPVFNGLSASQYNDFSWRMQIVLITLTITFCSTFVFLNFFLLVTDQCQPRSLSDSGQYFTSISWAWRELYIAAFPLSFCPITTQFRFLVVCFLSFVCLFDFCLVWFDFS